MPLASPIDPPTRFAVTPTTDALWRVTFDNPPINLIDPTMIVELHNLLSEIEQDDGPAVVVFDSADSDFFLAHYDVAADPGRPMTAASATAGCAARTARARRVRPGRR